MKQVSQFLKQHILLFILIILIIGIYTRYYVSPSHKIEVIQSAVANLQTSHLFEKHPIIIHDRIVTPYSLIDTIFKYLYVYKNEWIIHNKLFNPYIKSKSRFTIVYASSDINIQLVHPHLYNNGKPTNVITFKIEKHQILIIPMYWWYSIQGHAFMIELESVYSGLYRLVSHSD